jgi:hypothetical protein
VVLLAAGGGYLALARGAPLLPAAYVAALAAAALAALAVLGGHWNGST